MNRRLVRSRTDKKIAGVCGGIAQYFDIDPIIVRIIFVLALIFGGGTGLVVYIIMWIVVPEESILMYDPLGNPIFNQYPPNDFRNMNAKVPPMPDEFLKSQEERKRKRYTILGAILIVFGVLILVNNISGFLFTKHLFPLTIILIGAYILFTTFNKQNSFVNPNNAEQKNEE